MTEVYRTAIANIVVPRRVPLGPGVEVTQTPLLDPTGPGLAHLDVRTLVPFAKSLGARLPTLAEMLLLHQVAASAGTELVPVILPDDVMRAAGCVPGDPRMSTLEWCRHADADVLAQIQALGDIGDAPVANAGKSWVAHQASPWEPPAGKSDLCGWWVHDVSAYSSTRRGPGFIQQGGGWPHADTQADYGSTALLVWSV